MILIKHGIKNHHFLKKDAFSTTLFLNSYEFMENDLFKHTSSKRHAYMTLKFPKVAKTKSIRRPHYLQNATSAAPLLDLGQLSLEPPSNKHASKNLHLPELQKSQMSANTNSFNMPRKQFSRTSPSLKEGKVCGAKKLPSAGDWWTCLVWAC